MGILVEFGESYKGFFRAEAKIYIPEAADLLDVEEELAAFLAVAESTKIGIHDPHRLAALFLIRWALVPFGRQWTVIEDIHKLIADVMLSTTAVVCSSTPLATDGTIRVDIARAMGDMIGFP